MHLAAIADALDPHEEDQLLPVLRLCQNQDGADLCDGLGEDRGWQHRGPLFVVPQVPLVERYVLDADDTAVRLEIGDPIDQQERVSVRKNPLDRGVVQRKLQAHARGEV